jgi:hypothetical protein
MKLTEIAFACYVYGRMTDYDSSYKRFLEQTSPQLDLRLERHLMVLLKWLNEWGCRQFAKDYHVLAASGIREWYEKAGHKLLQIDKTLASLAESDIAIVELAYGDLVGRTASYRKSSSGAKTAVDVGATGASKILFVLRPDGLIPWDEPIRKEMDLNSSASSYVRYLNIAKRHLEELSRHCAEKGIALRDLPVKLGRPESSVAKLVDEFFWVTVSRKCPVPEDESLRRWVSWL